MDKIDILVWVIGIGFSFNFALLLIVWTTLTKKIDKLDEKVTDIDRRLCRLEGAFSSKECCRLTDEKNLKKVD
jgi:hypothetical protein